MSLTLVYSEVILGKSTLRWAYSINVDKACKLQIMIHGLKTSCWKHAPQDWFCHTHFYTPEFESRWHLFTETYSAHPTISTHLITAEKNVALHARWSKSTPLIADLYCWLLNCMLLRVICIVAAVLWSAWSSIAAGQMPIVCRLCGGQISECNGCEYNNRCAQCKLKHEKADASHIVQSYKTDLWAVIQEPLRNAYHILQYSTSTQILTELPWCLT
jgi:hypothetical protein